MPRPLRKSVGFTLVEILIIVAILGILAALVVPHFTNAALLARANSIKMQLNTVRKELEVYRAQHGGQYPTLTQLQQGTAAWGVLTSKTDSNGNITATGSYGVYLSQAPINAFTQSSTVVTAGAPAVTAGWTYDAGTGKVKAVIPGTVDLPTLGLSISDYEIVTSSGAASGGSLAPGGGVLQARPLVASSR